MRIQGALAFWARHAPDKPAIAVGRGVVCSYQQLHLRTLALAHWLSGSCWQLKPRARVVILTHNCVEFFECLFACWHAGLIVVPVNNRLHPREIRFIVKQCDASLCLASGTLVNRFIEVGVPVVDVDSPEYRQARDAGPMQSADTSRAIRSKVESQTVKSSSAVTEKDTAWIFYTSGTTGQPKGAMLSFRNLEVMCSCYLRDVDNESPWSSILHPAPLSHGSGLYSLAHFLKGSCQVLPESGGFSEDETFDLMSHWSNCVFFAAPTMIRRLTHYSGDADTAPLKNIMFGGAPMYFEDIKDYIARFGPKLAQLYGQGESPMTITAYTQSVVADMDHPQWQQRVTSAGRAQSAVTVFCVDERGYRVEAGDVGEVIVKGETVMQGYWDNAEATNEALRNGWLYTGDIGSFDTDGYLTLKDRSKDLVISGGSNIYPREVEEVLLTHPDVAEVSVIGRPDREWGELVVAYVVRESDPSGSRCSVEELIDALDKVCIDQMARFKRPRLYRFVDSLPKNNYGKILKSALRLDEGQKSDSENRVG